MECSITANYHIPAILRDIWRTEQRHNGKIAVNLCHRGMDDEWLPQ